MIRMLTRTRNSLRSLLAVAVLAVALPVIGAPLIAADGSDASQLLINFDQAMLGQDFDAKRQAVRALGDPAVGNDDDILPRLVAAVEDRQASDDAIMALRERTGLIPSRWRGQSHYPGYPWSDDPQAWQAWLIERDHARAIDQHIDRLGSDVH
jgi:hypothetical protein